MKHFIALFSAAVFAMALPVAQPRAAEDKPRMPVTADNTEQKARFVTSLVTDSVASRTILESEEPEAVAALEKARVLVDEAVAAAEAGDIDVADAKLNAAVKLVMSHARRLSERAVSSERARQIYESRLATVRTMIEAYQRVADEKARGGEAIEQIASIERTLEEAAAYAAKDDHQQARDLVERAYATVADKVAELRDGDRLVKSLNFNSPKDEYVYEIDRNDSHFYLLKLTLSEKTPHPMFKQQIEDLRAQAEDLRHTAENSAGGGDHQAAIDTLGKSTALLIRALRMAGAYIPG